MSLSSHCDTHGAPTVRLNLGRRIVSVEWERGAVALVLSSESAEELAQLLGEALWDAPSVPEQRG